VACKALGIHATYLVADESEQLARYEQVGQLAEAAIAALPKEANSHYRFAFGMGRYSQGISIAKALKMGLATKVRKALEATLERDPKHAEAHTALGLYHAEIISKIGALVGGMTYGAKASEAEKHLATALKLTPDSPIAHLEYGNLLLLLHGEKREDDAAKAFEKAGKLKPRDAMEALDAAFARSQLE
jgi:tetratricopeptide (TPR) repeat protein